MNEIITQVTGLMIALTAFGNMLFQWFKEVKNKGKQHVYLLFIFFCSLLKNLFILCNL